MAADCSDHSIYMHPVDVTTSLQIGDVCGLAALSLQRSRLLLSRFPLFTYQQIR